MANIVVDARIRRASTGRYVDRLLEYLQDIDHENRYTVLLEPDDAWQPKAQNFKTVPCRYKQFSFNPLEQVGFARQLYKLKPDLVHFTMTQQPVFYFGRIVTTTHDLTMLKFTKPGRLPNWLHGLRVLGYRFLFWWGHRKSKYIIVPSRYVQGALHKLHPFTKNKTVVTYEAADELEGETKDLKNVKMPFIFHVGSPFPHKNIWQLVEAFIKVRADHPDLNLVLAGKPEFYFDELKAWVENLPIKNSVVFPGRVSDSELKWLFKNAEAYVLPSFSEGFGLPGLEAMANGCPLVSSNTTCLPEIYGDAAHYFNPANIDDMATKISEVIDSETLREDLIEKGKAQAAKYSWAKMASQTLAIYKAIL